MAKNAKTGKPLTKKEQIQADYALQSLQIPKVEPIGLAQPGMDFSGREINQSAPDAMGQFQAGTDQIQTDVMQNAGGNPNTGLAGNQSQPQVQQPQQDTFLGMNKNDIAGVGAITSGLATGYDIYDKLWGGGADIRDAQIKNQKSQAAYNDAAVKHKKDFYAGMKKSGLAQG